MNIQKKDREGKGPFIVAEVTGGLGKNILFTAVISALKKKHPNYKIIVITAWSSPYNHNPNIYRIYDFNQLTYFYDDYMFNDTIVMKIDPYLTQAHIKQETHLIETWCNLYDIPYDGEMPKLYLNPREIELIKDKVGYGKGKPLMVIHTNGGTSNPNSPTGNKSWSRDIPIQTAQSIVNFYKSHYRILHIKLPDQPILENVEIVDLPQRELFALIAISKKRLFIDSFSQHAAAALGLKSTVCWIGNKPEVFGYNNIHDNILPNVDANINNEVGRYKYMDNYALDGQPQEFVYDTLNMFDVAEISNSIKTQG